MKSDDLQVAILFCHARSYYKRLPQCDCYDAKRDARTYAGSLPVVAHPPCRMWSRARRRGLPVDTAEQALAPWAVEVVRRCGGVLEHPFCSRLWAHCGLPMPGHRDAYGFTVQVDQAWFGHRAEKATWLYMVGVDPESLPAVNVALWRRCVNFNHLGRAERQLTPPAFARYLVEVATRARLPAEVATTPPGCPDGVFSLTGLVFVRPRNHLTGFTGFAPVATPRAIASASPDSFSISVSPLRLPSETSRK